MANDPVKHQHYQTPEDRALCGEAPRLPQPGVYFFTRNPAYVTCPDCVRALHQQAAADIQQIITDMPSAAWGESKSTPLDDFRELLQRYPDGELPPEPQSPEAARVVGLKEAQEAMANERDPLEALLAWLRDHNAALSFRRCPPPGDPNAWELALRAETGQGLDSWAQSGSVIIPGDDRRPLTVHLERLLHPIARALAERAQGQGTPVAVRQTGGTLHVKGPLELLPGVVATDAVIAIRAPLVLPPGAKLVGAVRHTADSTVEVTGDLDFAIPSPPPPIPTMERPPLYAANHYGRMIRAHDGPPVEQTAPVQPPSAEPEADEPTIVGE